MFKMQIKMNEEKILRENVINLQKVYAAIDKIFADNGLTKEATDADGTLNYVGYNDRYDFGNFGVCLISLTSQKWFKPNCLVWLFGDNNDSGVWDFEDVLSQELEREGRVSI